MPIDGDHLPARAADPQAKAPSTKRSGKAKVPSRPDRYEVRVFVSYSHTDEPARARLGKHLAPLMREGVSTWFDGDVHAGGELDVAISRALRNAHIFVALISSDYLSSDYCWRREYRRAMGRRARGLMHVVGVVLRPCDWKATTAARFKLLPRDGRAVSTWRSADEALLDVTAGIRKVVRLVRSELAEAPVGPRRGAADFRSGARPKAKPGKVANAGKPSEKAGKKASVRILGKRSASARSRAKAAKTTS